MDNFFSTDEDDLDIVVAALDAELLGGNLGIQLSALDKIKVDYPQLEEQNMSVSHCWLKKNNIVQRRQNEHPTWDALSQAVDSLNPSLSEMICDQYC